VEFLEHWRLREHPFPPIGDAQGIRPCRASHEQLVSTASLEPGLRLRFHPAPLLVADVVAYLDHHLAAAAPEADALLASKAVARKAHTTGYLPRELNHLAKLALEFGGRQEYSEATLAAVDAVVRDMNHHQTLASE